MKKPILFWEVPYIAKSGKRQTVVVRAPHRRAAERGVPNHFGTAVECPPPAPKAPLSLKKKMGKKKK